MVTASKLEKGHRGHALLTEGFPTTSASSNNSPSIKTDGAGIRLHIPYFSLTVVAVSTITLKAMRLTDHYRLKK